MVLFLALLALCQLLRIRGQAFPLRHAEFWIYPAQTILCGALYNIVAYRTRSLVSCVFAHAVTNFLLGMWIMQTQQWGFW